MGSLIFWCGVAAAFGAAARSSWSPCALSMMSSITPLGERFRGHRWGVTAGWFILGAVAGGASLGVLAATGAAGLHALGSPTGGGIATLLIVAAAATLAAAVDAGVLRPLLPLFRRQVDDRWITRYRPWVYSTGFGWQIGTGVTTYVMTAAVFLVALIGVLTADPVAAIVLCTLFGAARGATVMLAARATNPERLKALHRRMDQVGPTVRWMVVALESAIGLGVVAYLSPYTAAGLAVSVGVVLLAARFKMGSRGNSQLARR